MAFNAINKRIEKMSFLLARFVAGHEVTYEPAK
jgi:hypothetical protein